MSERYEPIDCTSYDQLEDYATRRRQVRIVYRDDSGDEATIRGRITNLFSEDGQEFLTMDDGTRIRLDALVSAEGMLGEEKPIPPS